MLFCSVFVSRLARQLEIVYNMAVVKLVLGNFFYDESSRSASLKYTGGQDDRSASFNLVIYK